MILINNYKYKNKTNRCIKIYLLFFTIIAPCIEFYDMQENDLLIKIGKNITTLRKQQNITSKELGYRCDIEKSNLIAIEKGRKNITLKTLLKISKALGVEMAKLIE